METSHTLPKLQFLLRTFILGQPFDWVGLYLKLLILLLRNRPPLSLWTFSLSYISVRELGCGLSNPMRFYHTRGHYPGHRLCFHAGLVALAVRTSPQFDGLATSLASQNGQRVTSVALSRSLSWATMHFTHRIKKELSICQSSLCLDLVSFPVLRFLESEAP